MQYRVIRVDQADLEHGLFGRKGSQKKDHKYLLREWVNGKWKYYYTQAQIQAKKLGKQISKDAKSVKKEISKTVKNGGKNIKKSISKAIDNGKKKVDKALKNLSKTSTKTLKNAEKQINKGKKAVQKFLTEGPNIYATYSVRSGGLTGQGISDNTYAHVKAHNVIRDVGRGFGNAAKEITKGFKNAASSASDAYEYATGKKTGYDKFFDNAAQQLKYGTVPVESQVTDIRFAKSLDEYKKNKKKK